jgi:hypothetical protein
MDLAQFARDFVRRLDGGEFDGNVTEVADKLTHEQLLAVHAVLLERERPQLNMFGTSWRDAALYGV